MDDEYPGLLFFTFAAHIFTNHPPLNNDWCYNRFALIS